MMLRVCVDIEVDKEDLAEWANRANEPITLLTQDRRAHDGRLFTLVYGMPENAKGFARTAPT